MHCRFDEVSGDFLMYASGLVNARPVRLATHEEIAVYYLHTDMYNNPQDYQETVETAVTEQLTLPL